MDWDPGIPKLLLEEEEDFHVFKVMRTFTQFLVILNQSRRWKKTCLPQVSLWSLNKPLSLHPSLCQLVEMEAEEHDDVDNIDSSKGYPSHNNSHPSVLCAGPILLSCMISFSEWHLI